MNSQLRRYDKEKRGSFQISLWFYDWELSTVIGALRAFRKDHEQKALAASYVTFLKRLESKFSRALGKVLEAEFQDLKLGKTKPLVEEPEDVKKD